VARPADPRRRETILRAALEVFLEQGYSDTRLADIAQRAGVVISTLYLYFGSKEEMVRAIAQHAQRQLTEQLFALLGNLKDREGVLQFVETIFTFASTHIDALRMVRLDSSFQGIQLRRFGVAARGPRFQEAIQILSSLMDAGYIRRYEPAHLADMIVGFVRWAVEMITTHEEEEIDSFKEFCTQWFCNALLLPLT
jgi:AcrR family transcriptional regulator